ncbi:hypothetical protein H257_07825 [Aphanomyces astaci]|uniref:Rab-GAP TBC domain-containing protein n=1 Tax=Aphanomyces astaci TaxID=112090 RepID=W4GJ94_APHAT|nr:hypothetical protein H257_07825 [Aphanomyces astaci]ETV79059.1 hypothetical protein H257_07825 [Aphanomyces astaci]|eukprot:XP_009831778.1 hypothetical protein H257_07825 [Aphanomyces astaci]
MPRNGNFRKTYYKSLGVPVLHSAEVEASFAALLGQDTPASALLINITQLVRLTLEFGLPPKYRRHVWWVVSSIVPLVRDTETDTWEHSRNEKRAIYNDVLAAADVCLIDADLEPSTPSSHVLRVVRFYVDHVRPHLRHPSPNDDTNQAFDWVLDEAWVADSVARAVVLVMDDPSDQFWCTLAFLSILDRGFHTLQQPTSVSLQDLHQASPETLELVICRIVATIVH